MSFKELSSNVKEWNFDSEETVCFHLYNNTLVHQTSVGFCE